MEDISITQVSSNQFKVSQIRHYVHQIQQNKNLSFSCWFDESISTDENHYNSTNKSMVFSYINIDQKINIKITKLKIL